MDARLHAVSSRNMYSEQGFEALIRPLFGQVCHSLMVVSSWTPGSAHRQDALQIWDHRSRAFKVLVIRPSVRQRSFQSPSSTTACMNSFDARTELFEFCPETVAYASPLKSRE